MPGSGNGRSHVRQPVLLRISKLPMVSSGPITPPLLPPFRIEPRFVAKVWGSRDLRPWYDRTVEPGGEPIGEVWLTGDDCVAATGAHAGEKTDRIVSADAIAPPGRGCSSAGFAAAHQADLRQREAERAGSSRRRNGAEVRAAAGQDRMLVCIGGPAGCWGRRLGSSRA